MKTKKGFTLLELLIVIGILAILSTTVVLVINPAELLKKARDSQRLSDLSTLKTAIAYYITETADPSIGTLHSAKTYSDVDAVLCGAAGVATSTTTVVDGTGWIPIAFNGMTGGSPIGSLPTDPNKTTIAAIPGRYYVYLVGDTTNLTFKLVANMESSYYSGPSGAGNVEANDGGTESLLYEVGTDMDTALVTSTAACYNAS